MKTLGVRELKERMSEILRLVEEEGETIEVTKRGEVIAQLIPVRKHAQAAKRDLSAFWTDIDTLAAKIGAHLPDKVDAVEIMRDVRREL